MIDRSLPALDNQISMPQHVTTRLIASLPYRSRRRRTRPGSVQPPRHTCWRLMACAALLAALLSAAGCGKKNVEAKTAPPPTIPPVSENQGTISRAPEPLPKIERAPLPWTQVGYASWYVPEPAGRKTSSGEAYDRTALTAAHRLLPLNTLVRVTNLTTHSEAIVRINDRGPFVGDRIIDLSVAAAKAVDVWRPGTAKVKLEVVRTPSPIETGGRWCVQIGAFHKQRDALDLKSRIMDREYAANVLEFTGATGYWVRVRMQGDDKELARKLAADIKVAEAAVYLVRLD